MKTKMVLVGLALLFLNGAVAIAELDSLTDYDDFNTKKYNGCKYCINPEKWMGLQRGDYVTELQRGIKAKRARMLHRSWGLSDRDDGTEQGRNRMIFRDSTNMSGACFVPRIKKYSFQDCAANVDSSRVRIRYYGNFYDTDAADAGQGDGIIWAGIQMQRFADSTEKKAIFEVVGWVSECEGVDCATEAWSTSDGTNDPDLNFGTVKASKNKKELCIGYDGANHKFVFSYGNDVRTVDADHDLPALAVDLPSNETWHAIETRTDVENCSTGAISGFIDADIDNVMIREFHQVINTVTSTTGKVWMDRNLGASQVATSVDDAAAYGYFYQWGRLGDGHQSRTSPITDILSANDVPGHNSFILNPNTDWISPQNPNLWQGLGGINNPCPQGFRLPTELELTAEQNSWDTGDALGAFNSPLKLVMAGYREPSDGSISEAGMTGIYWTSTVSAVSDNLTTLLEFNNAQSSLHSSNRGPGSSVRCIQD